MPSLYALDINGVSNQHEMLIALMPCSYYSELAGPETAAKYQTVLFLAGSASAEFFADIGLCPFEAVKVSLRLYNNYCWSCYSTLSDACKQLRYTQ